MNWQTEKLFAEAKEMVSDEGVFTKDQIELLTMMIDKISLAVGKESDCNNISYNYY